MLGVGVGLAAAAVLAPGRELAALITSTDRGAAGRFIQLAGSILNSMGAYTVLAYHNPSGASENDAGQFFCKVPSAALAGPRFACSHNAGAPRLTAGAGSTGSTNNPNRLGASNTVTYGSWQHSALTSTGSITASTYLMYSGVGVDLAEISYGTTTNGSGSLSDDSANLPMLMNRAGLDRAYVGDIAYIAIWHRALTLTELRTAQNDGPLSVQNDLVCVYANGQIYDLNDMGVTIADRSARVTGALPPNTALGGSIVVADDFERSSARVRFSGAVGAGDDAVIEIRPRVQANEASASNGTTWQMPAAKVIGVGGIRPTFRFTSYSNGPPAGYFHHPWDAGTRPYFSYDLVNWTVFGADVTVNADNIEFRHTEAFAQDTVYVAASRLWRPSQLTAWITEQSAANPSIFKNVPSNVSGFQSGTFSAQTDELGRTIAAQPFYAFKISDGSLQPAEGDKRTLVLVSGVHAGEDNGDYMWKAAIEFLMGSDPAALNVRRHFDTFCYGLVNAPGRAGGGWRGSFVTAGDGGNDANRNFSDVDPGLEIVTIPRTAMLADLPDHVHVSIDFHGQWTENRGMFVNGTTGADFLAAINAVLSPATVTDKGASSSGSVTHWMGNTLTADFYTTSEIGEVTPMSDAEVTAFGEAWIKAISSLLDDELIPAA